MKQVINGKVYDTKTATLVASDEYWDGSNWDRHGRNAYLYKTKKGNFFLYCSTRWQGERDSIEALTVNEAKILYEDLPEHELEYAEAFGEEPEEA
ncbi:MAG: hypothetical protein ACOYYF_14970 [Chloroflexota bacterium]